jgi:hypothetical protein
MQWLLIILAATTILSASSIVWDLIVAWRLKQSGVVIDADIVESGHSLTKRNTGAYVIYEFTPNGSTQDAIRRRQMIWQGHYTRMTAIGTSAMKVRYLPTNPRISRLTDTDADNSTRDVAIIQTSVLVVITIATLLLFLT